MPPKKKTSSPKKKTKSTPPPKAKKEPAQAGPSSYSMVVPQKLPLSVKRVGVSSSAIRHREPHVRTGTDRLGQHLRVSGREFLTTVTVPSGSLTPGGVIYDFECICEIPATRLTAFAKIYERWRPVRYRFHFIPTQPTTKAGTIVFGVDPDPTSEWTGSTSSDNIAKARSFVGSRMTQVWQPTMTDIGPVGDYTSFWCTPATAAVDAEDRLVAPGRFVVVCAAAGSLVTGDALGMIELEYDINFYLPRLDSEDDGNSYTAFIPKSLFPVGAGTQKLPILKTVATLLSQMSESSFAAISAAVGASWLSALRNYLPYTGTDSASDDTGLNRGTYNVDWVFQLENPGDFAGSQFLSSGWVVKGLDNTGVTDHSDVGSQTTTPTPGTGPGWAGPQKLVYPDGTSLTPGGDLENGPVPAGHFEFTVGGQERGIFDQILQYSASTLTGLAGVLGMWVTLRSHTHRHWFTIFTASSLPGGPPLCTLMPRARSGHSESKVEVATSTGLSESRRSSLSSDSVVVCDESKTTKATALPKMESRSIADHSGSIPPTTPDGLSSGRSSSLRKTSATTPATSVSKKGAS